MNINPKVAASGVAGAVTIIAVWVASLAHLDVPAAVASAFTTIVAFAAGYFTKPAGRRVLVAKRTAGDRGGLTLLEVVIVLIIIAVFCLAVGWLPPPSR